MNPVALLCGERRDEFRQTLLSVFSEFMLDDVHPSTADLARPKEANALGDSGELRMLPSPATVLRVDVPAVVRGTTQRPLAPSTLALSQPRPSTDSRALGFRFPHDSPAEAGIHEKRRCPTDYPMPASHIKDAVHRTHTKVGCPLGEAESRAGDSRSRYDRRNGLDLSASAFAGEEMSTEELLLWVVLLPLSAYSLIQLALYFRQSIPPVPSYRWSYDQVGSDETSRRSSRPRLSPLVPDPRLNPMWDNWVDS